MYEFWYDYVKPKYGEKTKLCCRELYSLHKKRKVDNEMTIYIKIAKDVERRTDT